MMKTLTEGGRPFLLFQSTREPQDDGIRAVVRLYRPMKDWTELALLSSIMVSGELSLGSSSSTFGFAGLAVLTVRLSRGP